ncbi:cytochrome P450 [Nonomuraea sp. NPDC004297]
MEELLRYFTIADGVTSRLATEDVQIGGVDIKVGEGVIVSTLSADWDPAAFQDLAALDIERGARRHLSFGLHQCLGQNLARTELRIVFDTLFRRIPALRLAAPAEDLPFKTDAAVIYGLHELPVAW